MVGSKLKFELYLHKLSLDVKDVKIYGYVNVISFLDLRI